MAHQFLNYFRITKSIPALKQVAISVDKLIFVDLISHNSKDERSGKLEFKIRTDITLN